VIPLTVGAARRRLARLWPAVCLGLVVGVWSTAPLLNGPFMGCIVGLVLTGGAVLHDSEVVSLAQDEGEGGNA